MLYLPGCRQACAFCTQATGTTTDRCRTDRYRTCLPSTRTCLSGQFASFFDRLYLFECFVSPLIHWLGVVVQPIRIVDVIIIQQPSELSPDLTSITSVIKPLLSFQVASKHLEALLHIVCISAFCRQATGITATSRQATGR